MLNEQQIKNYQKDGYIIPNFKMPEEDLLEIENLHDNLIKKHPKYLNYCFHRTSFKQGSTAGCAARY